MKIRLLSFGKCKDKRLLSLEEDYRKRLPREWNFQIQEIPLTASASFDSKSKAMKNAENFFSKYYHGEYLIVLDEEGKQYSSLQFAKYFEKSILQQGKDLMFLIGPAEGLPKEIIARAQAMLSLSQFTFPHELCRLLFIEQLYRVSSILQGHPYHKE